MILMGLNLLTIALEAGAIHFSNYPLLLPLVKNELCRSLLQAYFFFILKNFILIYYFSF